MFHFSPWTAARGTPTPRPNRAQDPNNSDVVKLPHGASCSYDIDNKISHMRACLRRACAVFSGCFGTLGGGKLSRNDLAKPRTRERPIRDFHTLVTGLSFAPAWSLS